ncbi:MAG: hypothetical protein AAF415_05215 [Pseudomonadota bacterium]
MMRILSFSLVSMLMSCSATLKSPIPSDESTAIAQDKLAISDVTESIKCQLYLALFDIDKKRVKLAEKFHNTPLSNEIKNRKAEFDKKWLQAKKSIKEITKRDKLKWGEIDLESFPDIHKLRVERIIIDVQPYWLKYQELISEESDYSKARRLKTLAEQFIIRPGTAQLKLSDVEVIDDDIDVSIGIPVGISTLTPSVGVSPAGTAGTAITRSFAVTPPAEPTNSRQRPGFKPKVISIKDKKHLTEYIKLKYGSAEPIKCNNGDSINSKGFIYSHIISAFLDAEKIIGEKSDEKPQVETKLSLTDLSFSFNFKVERVANAGVSALVLTTTDINIGPSYIITQTETKDNTLTLTLPIRSADTGDDRRFFDCRTSGFGQVCLETAYISDRHNQFFPAEPASTPDAAQQRKTPGATQPKAAPPTDETERQDARDQDASEGAIKLQGLPAAEGGGVEY